jgi:hypothetical protein
MTKWLAQRFFGNDLGKLGNATLHINDGYQGQAQLEVERRIQSSE